MAQQGYYLDPPSRRLAFDDDGTIVIAINQNSSQTKEFTTGEKQSINDESSTGYVDVDFGDLDDFIYIIFIFPEERILTHYYAAWNKTYHYTHLNGTTVEGSVNTTNGIDGNWTTIASSWNAGSNNAGGATYPIVSPGFPGMRVPTTQSTSPIKAIRFKAQADRGFVNSFRIYSHHLYGHKAPGQTPHRIDFAYADGSELLQDFDYGDQPRGSARIWSPIDGYNVGSPLYLRNRSPNLVATDISLILQNLSGNMINRMSLSKDNVSYTTQLTWTEIQPLSMVGPVYVKHTVEDSAALGLYTARLKLVVGDWS